VTTKKLKIQYDKLYLRTIDVDSENDVSKPVKNKLDNHSRTQSGKNLNASECMEKTVLTHHNLDFTREWR
jgi:hypothetical protein